MNEAGLLLLEGASMDQIDRVATRFGFPMGPIALHDLVGLDTAYYAGKVMSAAYSDRTVDTHILGQMVEAGRLGRKSGAGFLKYTGKKGAPADDPTFTPFLERNRTASRQITNEEIEDRLLLAMLMEAVRLPQPKIYSQPIHFYIRLFLRIAFPP